MRNGKGLEYLGTIVQSMRDFFRILASGPRGPDLKKNLKKPISSIVEVVGEQLTYSSREGGGRDHFPLPVLSLHNCFSLKFFKDDFRLCLPSFMLLMRELEWPP
jgi:hypothetical protein